uniref:Putative zinc knuckle protein n=1 Tax=Pectinaria gouldii TaxID=260746 RepID=A0A0K1R031_PECGU|nr:putative zinc knuckle protein [Pectinaria gouldii]
MSGYSVTGQSGVRATCKKCGYVGHLTFQCRNFMKIDPAKDIVLDVSSTSTESSDEEFVSPLTHPKPVKMSEKEGRNKRKHKKESKTSSRKKHKSKHKKHKHTKHSSDSDTHSSVSDTDSDSSRDEHR